jgi:hypothetical protein
VKEREAGRDIWVVFEFDGWGGLIIGSDGDSDATFREQEPKVVRSISVILSCCLLGPIKEGLEFLGVVPLLGSTWLDLALRERRRGRRCWDEDFFVGGFKWECRGRFSFSGGIDFGSNGGELLLELLELLLGLLLKGKLALLEGFKLVHHGAELLGQLVSLPASLGSILLGRFGRF